MLERFLRGTHQRITMGVRAMYKVRARDPVQHMQKTITPCFCLYSCATSGKEVITRNDDHFDITAEHTHVREAVM